MMDMYFESSYDNILSLDEMLDTDLKYSLELGLEVKDGVGINSSGPGLGSEEWGSWSLHNDGGASSFDFLASVDTSNSSLMVNPKNVIPSLLHSSSPKVQTEIMQFKTEPDSADEDDDDVSPRKLTSIKREPEDDDEDEGDDEDEDDDGSEEEDDDDQEPERPQQAPEVIQPPKKKIALTTAALKVSQVSGKPRTMWLLSKSQIDKGSQIVNATGPLIRVKPSSDMVKSPSPTVTSNGVQIIKPNPNKIKVKQIETMKSPPSPIITSNGVQILKPNPNITAKAKMQVQQLMNSGNVRALLKSQAPPNQFPKPAYSYSCLIAMALKNSISGSLPVSEIYGFMCEHFPYFRNAPAGWKNSVRHNLSLNKCFEKIEKVTNGAGPGGVRKGCLWAMNPTKISKMDDEVAKWSRKDPHAIRRAMRYPDDLDKLERGEMKFGSISSHTVEEESGEDEVPEEEEREQTDSSEEDESSDEENDVSEEDSESENERFNSYKFKPSAPPPSKPIETQIEIDDPLELELSDDLYEELGFLQEVVKSSSPSSEEDPVIPLFDIQPIKKQRLCVISPPTILQTVRLA